LRLTDGMRRRAITALMCTGLLLPPAGAHAAGSAGESLVLDGHSVAGAPVVSSERSLDKGTWYVIQVAGTVSYYAPAMWNRPFAPADPNAPALCGTPEAAPMFGGPAAPVGSDAEIVFARPATARRCASPKLPSHWTNFQVGVTTHVNDYANLTPATGAVTRPAANHTYVYTVKGHNRPARFRLSDTPAADNYGELHIDLRQATHADCAQLGPKAFQTGSLKACEKAV
jgi:hypothetical protein